MKVPFIDLSIQVREVEHDVQQGWAKVLADTSFVLGESVAEFEAAFAQHIGVKHVVGVANGTDAIELALRAASISRDDEVLVPANTFAATALAVARVQATPVFVDVDATHQLVDVADAARKISKRTRAIIPVHLFGQIAPMDDVMELARAHNLTVIEDAAQCQGATQGGKPAGSFGRIAGTSFYPGKNLGAYGDAGALLTNDDALASKVRALRNYGSDKKYFHPELGFNSRLDSLQAVVLSAKLKRLAAWNANRTEAAKRYDELLLSRAPHLGRPSLAANNVHVWHLYVVRVPKRDALLDRMRAAGIGAGVHYPIPLHLQGAFAHLGHKRGDFPVAEQAAEEILSLPIFPGITAEQQVFVVDTLLAAMAQP